jgi:phosphatidylglycerophosphatase A
MQRLVRLSASMLGVGYLPVAPATAASAVTLLLIYLISLAGLSLVPSTKIVIDEVVGIFVSIAFVPVDRIGGMGGGLVLAFFLFRFYDIVKPFPAGWSQRLSGGWGVMTDDVLAGVYTNVTLRLFHWLFLAR